MLTRARIHESLELIAFALDNIVLMDLPFALCYLLVVIIGGNVASKLGFEILVVKSMKKPATPAASLLLCALVSMDMLPTDSA